MGENRGFGTSERKKGGGCIAISVKFTTFAPLFEKRMPNMSLQYGDKGSGKERLARGVMRGMHGGASCSKPASSGANEWLNSYPSEMTHSCWTPLGRTVRGVCA
jgi:hypothetical protein